MLLTFTNRVFDQVDGSMVTIGGDFVSNHVPDTLLGVEFRMIGRKVFHLDFLMVGKKILDRLALVPGGSIDIEVDLPSVNAVAEVLQKC